MENEKVKEIKKGLECCKDRLCEVCPRLKQEPNQEEDCRLALIGQSLTLINELESENEKLNKALVDNLEAYKDGFNEGAGLKKGVDDKLKTENQKLKDRISELEKGNEILKGTKDRLTFADRVAIGNKALTEVKSVVLPNFAERLKDDIEHHHGNYGDLSYSECEYIIDETLKEFING